MLTGIALAVAVQDWDRGSRRDRDSVRVIVNGDRLRERGFLDGRGTLVPMRAVFEALGADVEYVGSERRVIARKGRREIRLRIGDHVAYTPERTNLEIAPREIEGRVYVPLRFVSESFNYNVDWDRASRTATVTSPAGDRDGDGSFNGRRPGGRRDGGGR